MTLDLSLIWSAIIALGIGMYVLLDGFDLGVGILFPLTPGGVERDVMMNTIAPVWDGNETWLILGGASLLGAFPLAYSTLLPALYLPVMIMLFGLVFRGVAFEFRFKTAGRHLWWDRAFFAGSLVASFAQGALLGAFIQGVAVERAAEGGYRYTGGAFDWLTPFSVMTGAGLVCGYALLGATWVIWRTDGALQQRAFATARVLTMVVLAFVAVVSLWTPLTSPHIAQRWFAWPNLVLLAPIPLAAVAAGLVLLRGLARGWERVPFLMTLALFLLSYAGLAVSLWPYVVPRALTIWDAASPPESQMFLLAGVAALLPVILAYTFYSYRVFRGKVRAGDGYH